MGFSEKVLDMRTNWAISDAKRDEGLTTPEEIRRFDNISYGPYGTENLLDVYVRKDVNKLQPTIVNIHGGGWVYGSKEIYQHYCMRLALRGFSVVNINYRLAPESHFPIAVTDINQALCFLKEHGKEYFVDSDQLILIGDSAGGQLVSHYATVLTNPEFAALFDFTVPDVKVRAVGLYCGTYDGLAMAETGSDELFLGYLGYQVGKVPERVLKQVDALSYMTKDFPPAFIMSAYNDFLFPLAKPMEEFLTKLGVETQCKIYGTPEQKEIAHVFHVDCKLEEAKKCNDDACAFFRKYVDK